MKKIKKGLLISVLIIVTLIIVVLVFTNFITPAYFNVSGITYYRLDNNDDEGTPYDDGLDANDYFSILNEEFQSYKTSLYDDQQFLAEYSELPSDNPHDYIHVVYHINGKNLSFFDIDKGIVFFDDISDETKFFLFTDLVSENLYIDRLSENEWIFSCEVYVEGLSEEEIFEKLKNVSLQISYKEGFVGNKQSNIQPSSDIKITEAK